MAGNGGEDSEALGQIDGLFWSKDLGRHGYGDYSMAVVQANGLLEDQSQLESCSYGTFVGVYDGHGGAEVAHFLADNLFEKLIRFAGQEKGISENSIKDSYSTIDEDFLSIVKNEWLGMPQIASSGSCCLTGMVTKGFLYIANAGDSRAVLGKVDKGAEEVHAIQLSIEHNANRVQAREVIQSLHPDDPNIVVLKNKVWRVKGIIQVTKSIGDAYLKKPEFNRDPLAPKFRLNESFNKPIISADPSILLHPIQPEDQFVIFASDGLWEHITNQDAVSIVHNNPREGAARRLVMAALQEASRKRNVRYVELEKIEAGVRRHFHDDITVVIMFIDSNLVDKEPQCNINVSVRGARGATTLARSIGV